MFSIKNTTLNALENKYSIVKSTDTSSNGPPGELDTTFGPNEDGKIITSIDNNNNFARSVEIDDTYIYVCGHTSYTLDIPPGGIPRRRKLAFIRYKKDDYESSISINTHIDINDNTNSDTVCAQLKSYNDSIYVCGYMGAYTGEESKNTYDFIIVKYTNTDDDITLDTTFGTDGILTVNSGIIVEGGTQDFFDNNPPSLAIDDTGVYVSGTFSKPTYDFGLFKCNYDGILDTNFGTQGNGTVTTTISIPDISKSLQLDGEYIYVAGSTRQTSKPITFAVLRYHKATGVLDTQFGHPITPEPDESTPVSGILVDSSDSSYGLTSMKIDKTHIYLSGTTISEETPPRSLLIKYNKSGELDTTFGNSGMIIVYSYLFTSIDLDKDYLYGCGSDINNYNTILTRYRKNNGTIDNTFGTEGNGIVVTDSDYTGVGYSVKLDNSYIYVAATRNSLSQPEIDANSENNSENTVFALYRYTNSTSETNTIEKKLVAIKFKSL